ncbi:single-stranded DNA-binding protein [compost metagenome]
MTQSVTLIGHLGANAEITTVGERDVCKFRLATKEFFTGGQTHTEWHFVEVWGAKGAFARLVELGKLALGAKATLLNGAMRNTSNEVNGQTRYFHAVNFQLHPANCQFELPQRKGDAAPAAQGQAAAGNVAQSGAGQNAPTPEQLEAKRKAEADAAELAQARERAAKAAQELAQAEAAIAAQAQAKAAEPVVTQEPTNLANDMDDDIPF